MKVLLILDGDVAFNFLQKIISEYHSNNEYVVVCKDLRFIEPSISSFTFHHIDYTSSFRLLPLLMSDTSDVFIILENRSEIRPVYNHIRSKFKKLRIITHCDIGVNDENLLLISEVQVLSARLLARVPNVPAIPHGFGLEQGEVMEIGIPSGSVFAHRQIGTIRQKDWRIVGIYRNGEFKLASYQMVIWPGDTLLVAGDPSALNRIYRHIRSDIGQFPSPFGPDTYLYIDMRLQSIPRMINCIREAIFLHRSLKSLKLSIRVLEPNDFSFLDRLVSLYCDDIDVLVDYNSESFVKSVEKYNTKTGLIVLGHELFSNRRNRRALFRLQKPVYKVGANSIIPKSIQNLSFNELLNIKTNKIQREKEDICEGFMVVSNVDNIANISAVVFDISKQLGFDVHLYDFELDSNYNQGIEDECHNLARIFNRKLKVSQSSSKNPILHLSESAPVLQFIPFAKSISKTRTFAFLKTNFDSFGFIFGRNPQVLLPL